MRVVAISALLLVGFGCSESFCSDDSEENWIRFDCLNRRVDFAFSASMTRKQIEREAQRRIKEDEEWDKIWRINKLKQHIKDCTKEENAIAKCIYDNDFKGKFILKISCPWDEKISVFCTEIINETSDKNLTEEETKSIGETIYPALEGYFAVGITEISFINKDSNVVNVGKWKFTSSTAVSKW
jgi:hypothetical protein